MSAVHIELLEHREQAVAAEIHAVQMVAYTLEATLLRAKRFPPLERSIANLQSSSERFLGAIEDGAIVGALSTEMNEEAQSMNIVSLVVSPHCHRRGIGRSLVGAALAECGNAIVSVSTGAENGPALALYAEFGFVEHRRSLVGPENIELVKLIRKRPNEIKVRSCEATI